MIVQVYRIPHEIDEKPATFLFGVLGNSRAAPQRIIGSTKTLTWMAVDTDGVVRVVGSLDCSLLVWVRQFRNARSDVDLA